MKKYSLLFLLFFMCGGSDTNTTSNIVQDTTTTTVLDKKTTVLETTISQSDNYLDFRDIKLFRASTISDQHVDILTKYIQYTEQLLFTDERVKRKNLYPIIIVQLDSENYESAIGVEEEYCKYL